MAMVRRPADGLGRWTRERMRYTQYYYPLAHWDTVRISTTDNIGLYHVLVGGFNPSETYESQLGWLFPTEWENNKNVPSHQPIIQTFWYPALVVFWCILGTSQVMPLVGYDVTLSERPCLICLIAALVKYHPTKWSCVQWNPHLQPACDQPKQQRSDLTTINCLSCGS
jgi:hypothetical protein